MSTEPLEFDLNSHLVLKTRGGSHAYGTNTEDSDEDFRGVIIPPENYFTGLKVFREFAPTPEGPYCDVVYQDIRKFLRLAMDGNPSVLEVFHAPRLRIAIPFANSLLAMWPNVLSKKIVRAHLGMARAHVKRIEHPNRKCGEKGKKAIKAHGYNTKDACHVIRVLEQCIEILTDRSITLPRPNADILLAIRNGEWSVEKFNEVSTGLIGVIEDLETKSDLPKLPDFDLVERNCVQIVHGWIYHKRCGVDMQVIDRENEDDLKV